LQCFWRRSLPLTTAKVRLWRINARPVNDAKLGRAGHFLIDCAGASGSARVK
jgi:hypothetical protein